MNWNSKVFLKLMIIVFGCSTWIIKLVETNNKFVAANNLLADSIIGWVEINSFTQPMNYYFPPLKNINCCI